MNDEMADIWREIHLYEKAGKKKILERDSLSASYTVEAAGVMAVVLFTIMILMGQAFRLSGETRGLFQLHEQVERVRHEPEHKNDGKISIQSGGNGWNMEISAPVFRPESFLRMWSLIEDR